MTHPNRRPLLEALEAHLGRPDGATDLPPSWLDYAAALVAARRRVLETPPCPTTVRRRVEGLFERRRPSVAASVLRLVFDSWRTPAPAMRGRGAARELRYELGEMALDVRVLSTADGRPRLQLAVEPPRSGLRARAADGSAAVDLDEDGCGELLLPASADSVTLEVVGPEGESLRAPDVPLE